MSQSHDLQLHIVKLQEIRSILTAMKNLALIEAHKLARFQPLQSQTVAAIELAASDFLNFYPQLATADRLAQSVCIMVGTERGFCGDFNEKIINADKGQAHSRVIAIGTRLANKLAGSVFEPVTTLTGANVAEEVPNIVNCLIDGITPVANHLNNHHLEIGLTAVYHDSAPLQISHRQLLPLCPQQNEANINHHFPPLLYLKPEAFFSDLLGHYLFAALHEILYVSLAAENHRRLQHLEGAINHLDDGIINLHRKSQTYRQEEITEEIEVILLNAENI
ncbi:MAG: F0F1 ATP synthase subunit gamma [Methylovulum sp.]|nr:F0F1 ATP synthase subunit gamma [Methylovulum sp.]